ncbi:MAG: efflux RND transporter periplasmic adaptor subunit [Acidobacteriota bacterium]
MKAKKPVGLIVTLAVLAAAGYGGYVYYKRPPKLTYVKAQVTRGAMEAAISATGTLSATRSVAVGSRVSGNVVKMYADYNTPVRKGQLLAEIDPSTFQNAVDQRQAALASAKTQILQAQVAERRADIDIRNAETTIVNQRAAVARAKSTRDEAKRKYDLQKGLADGGIASRDSVDSAKATWDQAVLSLESAESQLLSAQATLESTKAQREVTMTQRTTAEAQIKQAEGQLSDANLQLGFTRIEAPVDGVVIARNMNEGQTVQASTTAPQLYEIAEDLREMHLDTNIDESDISRVQLGQDATFTVDAFPGQTFRGEVIQVRRAAVNVQNVVSYTVVISVDNQDLRLFPGMTANTRIIVERVASSLRIPSAALRFRPPDELKVIGDTLKGGKGGFGGFGKGGDDATKSTDTGKSDAKETSKAEAPTKTVAQAEPGTRGNREKNVDASVASTGDENTGGFRRRGNGGETGGGRGNFDPSQFKGRFKNADGSFDVSQFKGKNFDPSQFKGRAGARAGATGGNGFPGAGRGGFTAGVRPTFQLVYRLTDKNELEGVRVRTGITDGNWVQLLGNNLQEGAELVTSVEGLPASSTQTKGNNFNQFPGGGGNFKGKGGFGF